MKITNILIIVASSLLSVACAKKHAVADPVKVTNTANAANTTQPMMVASAGSEAATEEEYAYPSTETHYSVHSASSHHQGVRTHFATKTEKHDRVEQAEPESGMTAAPSVSAPPASN